MSAVGLIHGLIFYVVRSRQRQMPREIIGQISGILSDVVKYQRSIITMLAERPDADPKLKAKLTLASAQNISSMLLRLDDESLRRWQARFPG